MEREPERAVEASLTGYRALFFNPRSKMFGKVSLRDRVIEHGIYSVLTEFEYQLDQTQWTVYEVRRLFFPRNNDATRKGPASPTTTLSRPQRSLDQFVVDTLCGRKLAPPLIAVNPLISNMMLQQRSRCVADLSSGQLLQVAACERLQPFTSGPRSREAPRRDQTVRTSLPRR